MSMMPNNRSFMIRGEDGQEYGPVDLSELRDWVLENRVGLGTEVRLSTPNEPWLSWHDYPELVALLAEVKGTTPVAGFVIAPLRRRLIAWFIDLFLLWILYIPIMNLVGLFLPLEQIQDATMLNFSNPGAVPPELLHQILLFDLIVDSVVILYVTGFIAAHGKTPGKAIMRLAVVDENGVKPTLPKALARGILFVLSLNFLFPLLYVFIQPQKRALHDLLAGTYVVEAS